MTLETLESYSNIIANIKSIKAERQAIREIEQIQKGPYLSAVLENLETAEKDLRQSLKEVEEWIQQLDDPEIESIVRWHYIIGYSWKDTNTEVYGFPDYHMARKKINRYFGREK